MNFSQDDKIRKSLRYSYLDGVFASAMTGFTQDFFVPFLLLLGATARHVAMLSAFPNLFASLVQVKSADIAAGAKSRKFVINSFAFLQALMFLPMVVMAWTCAERPGLFISIVVLYTAFGAIVAPAWSSLMSDHIAQNKRGSYFGWRNRTLGYITVAAAFAGGIMLNVMKKVNVFHGFLLLFAAAFLCRMVSVYFLTRMYEPWLEHSREHQFTLLDFIGRMRTSNFGRFVSFVSLMTFAVFLASPFFSLFMLRELRFSYFQFTVVTVSSTLAVYFAMQRWGNHADRVGNLRIVKFTAPLLGVIPLLWVINRHPVFLIMAQIFSGFMWAGFNLCAANFVLDAVTPEKRTRCVSFFNLFNGVAVCAGSLAGGYLIRWLPPLFGFKLLTLFLISGVLRMAAAILLPRSLKEVRDVEEIKDKELLLSVTGIRPWKRQI